MITKIMVAKISTAAGSMKIFCATVHETNIPIDPFEYPCYMNTKTIRVLTKPNHVLRHFVCSLKLSRVATEQQQKTSWFPYGSGP